MNSYNFQKFNEIVNYSLLREQIDSIIANPARCQLKPNEKPTSYFEGDQEYNIWYHKHLTDRYDYSRPIREVSAYKCDPDLDSGFTKADTNKDHTNQFFCIHFARGTCTSGFNCTYRHRVPTELDELWIEASRDVFGRERFGSHRDDMSGVGSFNHDCTTIFVGGLQYDRGMVNGGEMLENTLRQEFGKWGRIISLKVIHSKCIAFIKYASRLQAEFAKVAMSDQPLGIHSQILTVRWAYHYNKRDDDKQTSDPKQDEYPYLSLEKLYSLHESLYHITLELYQQILSNFTPEEVTNPSVQQEAWMKAYADAWTIYTTSTNLYSNSEPFNSNLFQEPNNSNSSHDLIASNYDFNDNLYSHSNESLKDDKNNEIGPITRDSFVETEKQAKTAEDINRMNSILQKINDIDEENFSVKF